MKAAIIIKLATKNP